MRTIPATSKFVLALIHEFMYSSIMALRKQSKFNANAAAVHMQGAMFADQETRVRVLRLFEKFINLADQGEVLDMLAMLKYWVGEAATLQADDRADVDLMAMAAEHFVTARYPRKAVA